MPLFIYHQSAWQLKLLLLLHAAFNHLITARDEMSFTYWVNARMPEKMAYRYVCIPHIPGFWDHILVGNCPLPNTEKMIGPDDYLPKLFNVSLGSYRFHWSCFVLKRQIILAMWCSAVSSTGRSEVFPLVHNRLKNITTGLEFRGMVVYLSQWFKVQYMTPTERPLAVVLDCKPSDGSSVVDVITVLASKSGMVSVTPKHTKRLVRCDKDHTFNHRLAKTIFTCPYGDEDNDDNADQHFIDIVGEFRDYGEDSCGFTQMCTNTEVYSYI